jgi:hypothetical protein
MSEPVTKNGRFSGKAVSNSPRLTTAGSTSTWPKSGLIVASTTKLDVTPYLTSTPKPENTRAPSLNGFRLDDGATNSGRMTA